MKNEKKMLIDSMEIYSLDMKSEREFSNYKKKFRFALYLILAILVLWVLALQVVTYQTAENSKVAEYHWIAMHSK